MLLSLQNKKIIISAGATGIGWAAAKVCLSKGAIVYLCDIDNKSLKKIQKHPLNNKKLFSYECDASDEDGVVNFFNQVSKKTKKIDALINNVGVAGPTGNIEKLTSYDWEQTLKINVISHFYFTKLAIPMLKKNKGGSIINLSSGAGIMGFPLRSPYAASKWAIIGVTKTLAIELGKYKIRVNAICPGTIKGDRMVRVIRDKAKFLKVSKKSIEKDFISMASMNSWILEEDIGKMCSFLISKDGERVSGQAIPVDGNATRMD
jgi:NAD(P)-dependent dehydrogenase (short-subunit alcohol dehydrogenase family)